MVALFLELVEEEAERQRRFPPGWRWMTPTADGGSKPYVQAAAVGVAHGFIIRGKQLVSPTAPVPAPAIAGGQQFRVLIKMAFSACVWAAAMAAGMLVYQHFLKRWEEKGLPVLPVAALTTVGAQQLGRLTQTQVQLPFSSAAAGERQREPSRPMSLVDEYEG